MRRSRRLVVTAVLVGFVTSGVGAQRAPVRGGPNSISTADLKEWLSYLASDQLEGRQTYTEGLGLAAAYIAGHLKDWGVKPGGDEGTYFQSVRVTSVRTTSKASVTVEVNGQTRTFRDGEGVTFPKNMGGKQTITNDQIQFVGYGLQVPAASIDDYASADPKGKVVVYMGLGPSTLPAGSNRLLAARSRSALEKGAVAVIGTAGAGFGGRGAAAPAAAGAGAPAGRGALAPPAGGRGGFGAVDNGDFTTVQHYDLPVAPALTAQDEFFEFLFSGSDVKYADLKATIDLKEALPRFTLKGVKMTVNVDADYTIVRTRLTRNVAGIIPGTDARLKETYVGFGAHYDHVGYFEAPTGGGRGGGAAPAGCVGQTRETPRPGDVINNGADDDGSGTVALMAIAKAFATGTRPKRSLLFVWHAGEESGLLGSRYNADYPIVPADKMSAVLNLDMVGRNRCDLTTEESRVYLVGSDRISTELHNLSEDANAGMTDPMTMDYEFNDPADPESLYTRSDHYSYAQKGIPIIFYTTGLHRDYHAVTDEVSKINFPKIARIAQLVYTTAVRVGNLDHAPARDNKGPRAGKGRGGKIK